MKLIELIEILIQLRDEHGDVDVYFLEDQVIPCPIGSVRFNKASIFEWGDHDEQLQDRVVLTK